MFDKIVQALLPSFFLLPYLSLTQSPAWPLMDQPIHGLAQDGQLTTDGKRMRCVRGRGEQPELR